MFVMDYTEGKGWHDPRIVPYGPMEFDPSTMIFHYAQAIFEGLKAYKTDEGKVLLSDLKNIERINISNDRLCIPEIDTAFALEALKNSLVLKRIDSEAEGTSLYIRPFIIATDPFLGVRASLTYKFMIILSPVGAYYKEGINLLRYMLKATMYVPRGGIGYAKTPGNYAAA